MSCERTDIVDIIKHEKQFLREELRHLKDCQLRYIVMAVGGTGAFFAVITTGMWKTLSGSPELFDLFIFLVPSVFVIPSAFIFFDKARTISRIVGYFRLLEEWTTTMNSCDKYIGWEASLREWRKKNFGKRKYTSRKKGTSTYWKIVYLSFVAIVASLLLIQIAHDIDIWERLDQMERYMGVLIIILYIITASYASVHLAMMVCSLSKGEKSYDANEEKWREVLGMPVAE